MCLHFCIMYESMYICIYRHTHIYVCIYMYRDMFIRTKIIHGVMLDPAKVCTGPSEWWTALTAVPAARWHVALSLRATFRNVSSQHLLLREFPRAHKKWRDVFFLPSHGQEGTEIGHQSHQCGEGMAQPWVCVPVSRAGWKLSGFWLWSSLNLFLESLTYCSGLMWTEETWTDDFPSLLLIYSDSLHWCTGQIKIQGHCWQISGWAEQWPLLPSSLSLVFPPSRLSFVLCWCWVWLH